MGGEYTPGNIVEVEVVRCNGSTASHAMWHFANWQLWGKEEDRLAWKGLIGFLDKEEIISELCRIVGEKSKEEKTGIFGLSSEELSRNGYKAHHMDPNLAKRAGSKGGKVSGILAVERNIGFFDPKNEDLVKRGRSKGGNLTKTNKVGIFNPIHDRKRKEAALKANSKPVVCLDSGNHYSSVVEASKLTLVNKKSIAACCRGNRKTAGGMRWAYV